MSAAPAAAGKLPMLKDGDPAAQATKYVSDVHRAKGAQPGASCSNCSLYGSLGADTGTCSLFPSYRIAAGGWCSAWTSL